MNGNGNGNGNNNNQLKWKWTKEGGDSPERSLRIAVRKQNQEEMEDLFIAPPTAEDAFSSSLHHDENTWNLMNLQNQSLERNEKIVIESQQIMAQRNQNPFFVNNNYVDDINKQNDFLKPISTTREK
jgi:hypothetical protein